MPRSIYKYIALSISISISMATSIYIKLLLLLLLSLILLIYLSISISPFTPTSTSTPNHYVQGMTEVQLVSNPGKDELTVWNRLLQGNLSNGILGTGIRQTNVCDGDSHGT